MQAIQIPDSRFPTIEDAEPCRLGPTGLAQPVGSLFEMGYVLRCAKCGHERRVDAGGPDT